MFLDVKQWAIEYYQEKGMEVPQNLTKEVEMVQKAAEAVQTSEYRVVMGNNKPKKCGLCRARQLYSVTIRSGKGAVGLAQYCTECGAISANHGKITTKQLTGTVLGQTIENLVETSTRQVSHA